MSQHIQCTPVRKSTQGSVPAQAQRLREQAEALFQKHRARGGHAAQRDQRLPQEERDALFELKKEGSRLWETANDLVQLASEQVLLRSQVRMDTELCRACDFTPTPLWNSDRSVFP